MRLSIHLDLTAKYVVKNWVYFLEYKENRVQLCHFLPYSYIKKVSSGMVEKMGVSSENH